MSRENFDEIMSLQRQMASRVVQENEMELQLKLLEIINSLVTDKNKQISTTQIQTVAEMEGIPETETVRLLGVLQDMGHIRQAQRGFFKRA